MFELQHMRWFCTFCQRVVLLVLCRRASARTGSYDSPDCTRGRRAIWNTHSGEKSNTREAGVPSAAKQVIIEARVSKQNSDHKPLMEIPTDPRNGLGRLNAHVSAVLPAASHLCTFAQILLEPKGLWLNLTINFWLHWIHIARSYFKALLSIVRNWRPDRAGSGQLIRASSAEVNPGKWRKDGSRCAATLASGPWRAQ